MMRGMMLVLIVLIFIFGQCARRLDHRAHGFRWRCCSRSSSCMPEAKPPICFRSSY